MTRIRIPAAGALLRARSRNRCIVMLYERTRVPVREIARLAGVSERNTFALIRRLRCRPRKDFDNGRGARSVPLRQGRPGRLLNEAGVRRLLEDFAAAVQRERAVADARLNAKRARVAERQAQRETRESVSVLEVRARSLRLLAEARSAIAVLQARSARRRRHPAKEETAVSATRSDIATGPPQPIHATASSVVAALPPPAAPLESEADRRLNAIAERFAREGGLDRPPGPRIRGL